MPVGIVIGRRYRRGGGCRGMRRCVVLSRKIPLQLRRRGGGSVYALDFDELKYEVWDGIAVYVRRWRGKLDYITPLRPSTTGRTPCITRKRLRRRTNECRWVMGRLCGSECHRCPWCGLEERGCRQHGRHRGLHCGPCSRRETDSMRSSAGWSLV